MQTIYSTSGTPKIPNSKVAILQAKWYKEITDNLVKRCIDVLKASDCPEPEVHIIPGALELPLAAQTLIKSSSDKYDAIICVGAIMKGETLHFDMIVDECMRGLGQVMLNHDVPIIVEVIPILSIEQLKARCGDDDYNKGIEAGMAAAEIISWRKMINER